MPNSNNFNLDDAINAMKQIEPTPDQLQSATSRVFDSLQSEPSSARPDRLRSDADFNAILPAYLRNELTEAQRLLVEDRLASHPAYRRQLDELRGNVRTMPSVRRARSTTSTVLPWAIAAGLLITTGYFGLDTIDRFMAPAGPRAEIASTSGELFKVSAAGLEPLKPGTPLKEGEAVRTAKASSAIVRLPDGSLIEMNERAELSISAAYSGSTIRLERGNILVQAAKQRRGSLKVSTRESTVSVKGTIFSVSSGLRGTQVAVVEGHVVVDQSGQREDLFPGQVAASQPMLRRTTVKDQIAWSKDSARYTALLSELSQISKQIQALPLPSLRHSSRLLEQLPANTVVYAAIPNISATIADSTRIFEDRMKQSPALREWWNTNEVAQAREIAEKLRTLGSAIGEEIVLGATLQPGRGISEPFLLAEVKGSRAAIEQQIRAFTGNTDLGNQLALSDTLVRIGAPAASAGFAQSSLAATVQKSYERGAGWILAVDLEQILGNSVTTKDTVKDTAQQAPLTGFNNLRHLMVERRDINNKSNTSASVSFTAPRTGIAAWLAAPAPMPGLDYISPEAPIAFSAVTKDAGTMAGEFFATLGKSSEISELEQQLGINILEDLAGPIGGEVTLAVDGPLVPVPTYVITAEVYNATRLTDSLRRVASRFPVTFSESTVNNRRFFTLKHNTLPIELNFTFDGGYMVGAQSRDTILKAIQTRNSLLSLPRSQRFLDLLPADAQVNASAVFYVNFGSSLATVAGAVNNPTLNQIASSAAPILITAYAGPDSITVLSSSGFFGLGIDSLLASAKGAPILPQLLAGAMGRSAIIGNQKVQ